MTASEETVESTSRIRAGALVTGAIAAGICLAAVQLIPTMELRQLSQRDGSNAVFNPAYGHMPPAYLSQLLAGWWYWHSPEIVQSRQMLQFPFLMSPADTNQVEAHLYIGLIPLALLGCLLQYSVRQRLRVTHWKIWLVLSGMAIIYAFGWLIPVTGHLPGFGFFMGPGRYTIITSMGFAVVSGLVLDTLLRRRSRTIRFVLTTIIAGVTLCDLLASGDAPVCDAQIVATPPIAGVQDSWISKALADEPAARLLAPGPNVGNLFGVSCIPQYLGLGPAEYFQDDALFETMPVDANTRFPTENDVAGLRDRGVTHILTQEEVQTPSPEMELVRAAPDSFLNRVWARGNAPCYLYRIQSTAGRIVTEPPSALVQLSWIEQRPSRQVFRITLAEDAVVSANELMFSGWQVSVDGDTATASTSGGFRRSVQVATGEHTIAWTYDPWSFTLGASVSSMALIMICVFVLLPGRPGKGTL